MSYLVLARKYRPVRFEDVLGQEAVTRTLANALRMGRVAHAYLFAGPRGVGKTSVARILAKALNCEEGPTPQPCGQCERCRRITAGHDLDVREIDAASNRGIDHIRELRDSVRYAPASGKHKVYIIDEVHQLTTESFNALLKTLEEPPRHVNFIFATTELDKVPETVRSRCQIFEFRSLTTEQIATHLAVLADREGFELESEVARAVAGRARGSLRDAQSLLDQLVTLDGGRPTLDGLRMITGSVGRDLLVRIVSATTEEREAELLEIAGEASACGASVADLFDQLLELLRELMVVRVGGAASPPPVAGQTEIDLAGRLDLDRILAMMQVVLKGRSRLRELDEHRLVLEMTLLKLSRLAGSLDLPAALSYLRRLRLPAGAKASAMSDPVAETKTAPRRPTPRPARPPEARKARVTPGSGALSAPAPESPPDPTTDAQGSGTPNPGRCDVGERPVPRAESSSPPVGGADVDRLFGEFLKALGCSSKRLMAAVREHYRPVRVVGTRLILKPVENLPGGLYDLRQPRERQLAEAALVEVLSEGASLEIATEDGGIAGGSLQARAPERTSEPAPRTAAERARDLFGGDLVEG